MYSFREIVTVIFVVIVGNILYLHCKTGTEVNTQRNVWLQNWVNNRISTQEYGLKSQTTPWPALGRQSYQNTRAPLWIRPNNGTNWVRNTPPPQQNPNLYQNTRHQSNNFETNRNNDRTNLNLNQNNDNNKLNQNGVFSTGGVIRQLQDSYNQEFSSNSNGDVTDDELWRFFEELLNKDNNSPYQYVRANFQGKTTSRSTNDEAPFPLLTVNPAAFSMPSIQKLKRLFDNYIVEANVNEVYTNEEKNEENDFLDVVIPTPVMQFTRNLLISKGKIGSNPQDFKKLLRDIWFNMYSRENRKVGSSGFEHVFLGELKKNMVSGLHNWVYLDEGEKKNDVNYLGYMKKIDLGKGYIIKFHFTFHGVDKPVNSLTIGTSPELDMAMYTTCFVLRADRVCPVQMNGNRFIIRTFTFTYKGQKLIGSAFPEI